jgi:phosphoesterase RecJ-like protein
MRDFAKILEAIGEGRNFLISTHLNPDGDAIGSELALFHLLRNLNKDVQAINKQGVPALFSFLPGSDQVELPEALNPPYDCSFALDCGQPDRTGGVVTVGEENRGTIINIDHHTTNYPWADLNWVDVEASSTAEMIHMLITSLIDKPDLDMACCVYTGLMTDTGSFRYSNTSSRALGLATELVEMGVDPSFIATRVYDTTTYKTLKLLGLTLEDLGMTEDGLVAWITVPRASLERTGTTWEATEEFINFPRAIPTVKIAIFFKEITPEEIKVSFRSKGRVNVSRVAHRHGGGGHINAAGCTLRGSLTEVRQQIISEVSRELLEYRGEEE